MKKQSAKVTVRLRDEKGRFTTNKFRDEVIKGLAASKGVSSFVKQKKRSVEKDAEQIIKEAKITNKELKYYYNVNKETFITRLRSGYDQDLDRNYNQLNKDIENYKGKIFLNGKEVSKHQMKYQIEKFKQLLSTEINVVDFTVRPKYYFDGKIEIDLPNADKVLKELMKYFDVKKAEDLDEFTGEEITQALKEILDNDDIVIYAS
jgi:hypothetical protein